MSELVMGTLIKPFSTNNTKISLLNFPIPHDVKVMFIYFNALEKQREKGGAIGSSLSFGFYLPSLGHPRSSFGRAR